jgi:hypothetical protein
MNVEMLMKYGVQVKEARRKETDKLRGAVRMKVPIKSSVRQSRKPVTLTLE